jgi:hypothetical protein
MKAFTCIVYAPWSIHPVQMFYTRCLTPQEAAKRAKDWVQEDAPDVKRAGAVEVKYVFEGKIKPTLEYWEIDE